MFKYNNQKHAQSRNYIYFLISLIATIILPALISSITYNPLFFNILFSITLIIGVYTATSTAKELITGFILGFSALAFFVVTINSNDQSTWTEIVSNILLITFFTYLFAKIFRELFYQKEVDRQTILAAVCGYLLIGMITSRAFTMCQFLIDDSFNLNGSHPYEVVYFAFVTITTLGYGDISPQTPAAQSLVVLFTVTAQIYLTVLIAILIGKFLAAKK